MGGHLGVARARFGEPTPQDARAEDAFELLTKVVVRALRELGQRGDPEGASRFAAQAWVTARNEHPAAAERLGGLLHYLARLHTTPAADISTKEPAMANADQLLDVRSEPPARRHDLIFESYTGLIPGTAFVLVNDHDPKPLYYQFAAEHADDFTWEYLEQGPDTWRVRIGRPDAGA